MPRLKIVIFIFIQLLTFLSIVVYAQSKELDSLWNLYNNAKHDTNRITLLNEGIGYVYELIDADSSILFYKNAISLADKNKALGNQILFHKATSYLYIGNVYYNLGNYDDALINYMYRIEITNKIKTNNS